MSRLLAAGLGGLLWACSASPPPAKPAAERPSLFLAKPDFELFVQPQELARDGQALSLSAARAEGASLGLGRILVASERLRVHTQRAADGKTNVGLAIEGAPSSMGPDDVVDEHGERLLVPCRGMAVVAGAPPRAADTELPVPCYRDQAADETPRRIYLVERRTWFVAAGNEAIAQAESALLHGGVLGGSVPESDRVIWQATYLGSSLRTTIPKLRVGPLAPLAQGLVRVRMTKERRQDRMEVVAEFDSAAAADEAEPLASRVLAAWSRTREDPRERLVSLTHSGATLRILMRGSVTETMSTALPLREPSAELPAAAALPSAKP